MNAKRYIYIWMIVSLSSCGREEKSTSYSTQYPDIYPDYAGVTIPANIAPLNFSIQTAQKAVALFKGTDSSFEVSSGKGVFNIPEKAWKKLLAQSKGKQIEITVTVEDEKQKTAYRPFHLYVADEPIDGYLAYRLIAPGYALWNQMGIYQRNLETYRESVVYENKMTKNNCVNCHSFCMQNPDKMLFHMRSSYAGTILTDGDKIEFLDTRTEQTISSFAYPSWHPSGKFVVFSVNKTTQGFHATQRVEVFDTASDIVVYDIENGVALTTPAIFSATDFETFPSFSADGRTLYFCSGTACNMPDSIQQLKYSLCSLSFDPETKLFGNRVDTLYNARTQGRSVSFPRVSPDGKFLLCTLSSYGTFPIWHKDADLYMVDLETGEGYYPETANSDDTDSYHSWSSNSRWVVFSSRRMDALYTRPFIVYIDKEGQAAKPFVLPQKEITYYPSLLSSYNIPEFITGKISNKSYPVMKKVKEKGSARTVQFAMK